jgi:hypothetical protein
VSCEFPLLLIEKVGAAPLGIVVTVQVYDSL